MGWSGYKYTISVLVDAHGGDREEIGELLHEKFHAKLLELCEDPEFNQEDFIRVTF